MDFRYPGPRPQTREAALVFLSDSVEAAAKSIPDPSHDRLKGMVHKIINMKFLDGQFEECDLTLRDLHLIAATCTRVLTGIYHHRPQYPHQKDEPKKPGKDKGMGGQEGESTEGGAKEPRGSAADDVEGSPGDRSEDDSQEGIVRLGDARLR